MTQAATKQVHRDLTPDQAAALAELRAAAEAVTNAKKALARALAHRRAVARKHWTVWPQITWMRTARECAPHMSEATLRNQVADLVIEAKLMEDE